MSMIEYIQKRIREFTAELFDVNYDEYLSSKGRRILICFFLSSKGEVVQSSAPVTSSIKDYFYSAGFNSKAGYAISESVPKEESNINADLIFFSEDFLSISENEIDKLLLHELCHFLIDSKIENSLGKSKSAIKLGNWLYNCTDRDNENNTRHTLEFCLLLANVAEKSVQNGIFSETPEEIIKKAMQFDAIFE